MGRKANLFNSNLMKKTVITEIKKKTIKYVFRDKDEIPTREYLKLDALVEALTYVSGAYYQKSKNIISDNLLDDLLSRLENPTKLVADYIKVNSGYIYDDLNNMVYYLVWFGCTDANPTYESLDEFANSLKD